MLVFHQDIDLFIFWHKSASHIFPIAHCYGLHKIQDVLRAQRRLGKVSGTRYKDLKQENLIDFSRNQHILSPCEFWSTWQNTRKINDSDVMPFHGATALVGHASSLLTYRDHTQLYTSHSVGLPWTSDQLVAEISTWQHTTPKLTDVYVPGGFEPTTPVSGRPKTHTLDSGATEIGILCLRYV